MAPILDGTCSEYGAWEPLRIYGAHPAYWGMLAGTLICVFARWIS